MAKDYKVLIEVVEDDGQNIVEITGCNTVKTFNNEEEARKLMNKILNENEVPIDIFPEE